jgi:RimJ/RimL family protein N-acetyltransferase
VVAFNNIEKMNRCATIGYWLARSKMGRGYMTAAVKALIDEGFQQLELKRIQARVATANYPSQAHLRSVRFKEGRHIAPS